MIRTTKPADYQRNPVKAIRRMCLECMGGSPSLVKDCTAASCNLFPFRLGTNPFRKPPSELQRANGRRLSAENLL